MSSPGSMRCSRCKETKAEEHFPPSMFRNRKKRGGYCHPCWAAYQRERLEKVPGLRDWKRSYDRAWKKRAQQRVEAIKVERGCDTCGEKHPAVLDFHHRDPSGKTMSVSKATASAKWETVELEMAKCELLCANCHRKRHYEQKTGSWWPHAEAMKQHVRLAG